MFDTGRPGGLHKRIYSSLLHAIISGRFAKGAKLPSEPELAKIFSVSRPVVRQALEKMRVEGIVTSQRGSGTYVAGLDQFAASVLPTVIDSPVHAKGMLDDLEFRLITEPAAAFIAAKRRGPHDLRNMEAALSQFENAYASGLIAHHYDFLFHEAIALATTNERLVAAARSVEYERDDELLLVRHLVHFAPNMRGARVVREHRFVLDLIQRREPEAARDAMANHIEASRQRLIAFLGRLNADLGKESPKNGASNG